MSAFTTPCPAVKVSRVAVTTRVEITGLDAPFVAAISAWTIHLVRCVGGDLLSAEQSSGGAVLTFGRISVAKVRPQAIAAARAAREHGIPPDFPPTAGGS